MKFLIIVLVFLFASVAFVNPSKANYRQDHSFIAQSAISNFAPSFQTPSWLDPTFGIGGKAVLSFGEARELAQATAIQSDGKILIAGERHASDSGNVDVVLARFNTDGTLDTSFNGNGTIRMNIPNGGVDGAREIITQSDGKILVGGFLRASVGGNTLHYFLVARFNVDGSPDTSFAGDGTAETQILTSQGSPLSFIIANSLVQLPDGKIVAAGTAAGYVGFAKYNSDGSLDTSFDGDGRLVKLIDSGSTTTKMVMQPDGKFVTVGWTESGFAKFAIARFNSDGTFDQSFGNGGSVISSLNLFAARAWGCALQPDGKIIVVGKGDNDLTVVRLNTDGSFDTTFDGDGIVLTAFSGGSSEAFSVLVLPDGKILAGGTCYVGSTKDFALTRYNPDGSLDDTFGNDGKLTTDFNLADDNIIELVLQSDGKIVAGGTYNPNPQHLQDYDFALVRYLTASRSGTKNDFDGDGKTDISIFRPSVGEWWYLKSSTGGNTAAQFGSATDIIAPEDYTGDGKTDIALWRPSTGEWFILRSENSSYYSFPFGTNDDIPAPADYDADGKSDAAVFRPSTSTWYISRSSGGTTIQNFGQSGDVPVASDYDGDGQADIAIYRVSAGEWWINRSTAGTIAFQFGNSSDKAVPGDYTGDGKADVAVWRPSTGEWFVLRSENHSYYSFPFGTNGDVPAPGDYDGDGTFDATVFRPSNSTWFIQRTTAGTQIQGFGQSGDRPVPNAFVP